MAYLFGMTSRLVDLSFPSGDTVSRPWYWWFPKQQPQLWSFISHEADPAYNGWLRGPYFPIIKILAADTQKLTPYPQRGFEKLEEAIEKGAPDGDFGRFEFTDGFFWKVNGISKPAFASIRGTPTAQKQPGVPPISQRISKAVKQWKGSWNQTAQAFNANVAAGTSGGYYSFPQTFFDLPLPGSTSVPDIIKSVGGFYLGAVPGGFWFQEGNVEIYKQAYSFQVNVGQLNPKVWDMSVFPPRKSIFAGGGSYGGYGQVSFPLAGPQIIGQAGL